MMGQMDILMEEIHWLQMHTIDKNRFQVDSRYKNYKEESQRVCLRERVKATLEGHP